MPTPIGGEKAPTPMAMIMTMPYWIGSMPKGTAIGSSSGPKIRSAGRPSRSAPIRTRVTTVASMKSVAEPSSTAKRAAIRCGILARVSDHDSVLAVLVMNSTMPACAAVVTIARQSCGAFSERYNTSDRTSA